MFNKTILQGNVVKDIELRETTAGVPVTTFKIAVGRRHKKNGEQETDFFNIVAWRGTAEFVSKYFGKGSQILVEGELRVRKFEDKDGNSRQIYEVVADEIYFCGSANHPQDDDKEKEELPDDGLPDDDIPF